MEKVCHITTVHPPFDTRVFHKECKTLEMAGYEVVLIAQHNKNEIIEGVKIIALPKPKNRFERMFFLTKKAYRLALEQSADIYHFHDPELIPWMIKLKKKTRANIIYDVHEDVPCQILNKHWLPWIIRKPVAWIMDGVEWLSAHIFDAIIPSTPKIADRFPKVKTVVIQNFPIITEILFTTNLIPYVQRPQSFVYVGVIASIRGIAEIVRAFSLLSDIFKIRLELAGTFSPNEFVNTLRALSGWTSVTYHGEISRKQLVCLLGRVRAGLVVHQPIPNEINAQPIKMFEYMAAGLPVIASNFPLWKEIIKENQCGICVNPLNPKEIARAIKYLIEHPEEAKKMGENGRKAVLEKYNWENEGKKLLKIYERLS